jgi:hypothetical protein
VEEIDEGKKWGEEWKWELIRGWISTGFKINNIEIYHLSMYMNRIEMDEFRVQWGFDVRNIKLSGSVWFQGDV